MIQSKQLRTMLRGVDLEKIFGVSFGTNTNRNVYCPFHESGESQSKSCSVSIDGLYNCKGCAEKGDAFDFLACTREVSRVDAIALAQKDFKSTGPKTTTRKKGAKRLLSSSMVAANVERLATRNDFLTYLNVERGLSAATLSEYQIGCDEMRITIPIFDEDNTLVNIRRYGRKSVPKMLSFAEGFGKPRLYPLPAFLKTDETSSVFLCEGEWDCMLLRQKGYNALTVTGGVTSWDSIFNSYFVGRKVYIVYDVNDKEDANGDKDLGIRTAYERAELLTECGAEVYVVHLTLPKEYVGGDVTDYFMKEKRTQEQFDALLTSTSVHKVVELEDCATTTELIPLSLASHSKYYFKKLAMRCLVAGKGIAPYMPPREITVKLTTAEGDVEVIEHTFSVWDGSILSLIQCTRVSLNAFLRAWFGVDRKTEMQVKVKSTFNIEEIFLIPAIDLTNDLGTYVIRKCYYIGHGIQSNRVYDFTGYTLPHPKDQAATHILTEATPAETDIDTFDLSEEQKTELRETFSTDNVKEKLLEISSQLAAHVTKIYGRPDLHTAVDLVYHSPLAFDFDGARLKKGWLELLILGDTRTGKGYVTEGLCKHYKAGEVVSGENLSLAGLVGGIQHLGDKWTLVWGKIPLADRRLIIMDEVGSLSHEDIGRLSRIRSEGLAEITKIVSEKTTARTRLIWLANPRPSASDAARVLADYNYGVEAVIDLVGATEDIARFDMVLNVAHNDVPSEEINRSHKAIGELEYTEELCHNLIMWIWSRKASQIVFSKEVVTFTMKLAQKLARQFTSKIPLIQIEDVRFKLARIGCAAAGRTFNSPDGAILVIEKEHIQFAYDYLMEIYSKPICGYLQMSGVEMERQHLEDPEAVKLVLEGAGEHYQSLIDGLLEHRKLSPRDLCDYANMDQYQARSVISELVRLRALIKEHSYYVKKAAFKDFLRGIKNAQSAEGSTNEQPEAVT